MCKCTGMIRLLSRPVGVAGGAKQPPEEGSAIGVWLSALGRLVLYDFEKMKTVNCRYGQTTARAFSEEGWKECGVI